MMKITIDMLKYDGERISRFENYTEEDLDKELAEKKRKEPNLALPRNNETSEERIHVTKTNWLGRREREHPKRERPLAPGGETKKLEDKGTEKQKDKAHGS